MHCLCLKRGVHEAEWMIQNAFDLFLLRYLRARAFNPNAALDFLKTDMAWREDIFKSNLLDLSPDDILGSKECDALDCLPHFQHGFDKEGRYALEKHYLPYLVSPEFSFHRSSSSPKLT